MVSLIKNFEIQQSLDSAIHDLFTKMQSLYCLQTKITILRLGLEVMIMSYETV